MAGSVNKVILVGNLGRDPEVRFSQNNLKIVNFSMATSESWKDRQTGERREKTEWHRIVVFNEHLAEICEKYLKKGNKVYVEGSLQTRKYEQDGVEKYSTEIVLSRFNGVIEMLGNRGDGRDEGYVDSNNDLGAPKWDSEQVENNRTEDNKSENNAIKIDDDIPF